MIVLKGIAIRQKSRAPMQELSSVHIDSQRGVTGDFRGRPGKRQVTVLSEQAWQQACNEIDEQLPWTTRRANLLISGAIFSAGDVGRILQIGQVRLRITRETDPCGRMDQAVAGLRQALMPAWRGGVCCTVVQAGNIVVGDTVEILDAGSS